MDKVGEGSPGHYVVFVGYAGEIADPRAAPEVYVMPSQQLADLAYVSPKGRRVVPLGSMQKVGAQYRDAWHLLGAG